MDQKGTDRMKTITQELAYDPTQLADYCEQHQIAYLAVFGSVVHGNMRPDSDLDVLVDFSTYEGLGMFRFMQLQRELSQLFHRPVDLVTRPDLSPYIRDEVLGECQVLYEGQ